jgi:phosphohistidine phosphatase
MKLYLVQHGNARPKSKDPDRALVPEGIKDVEKVARFAQLAGVLVHQIRHSGKLRAEQTAAILAHHLNPPGGVVAIEGLAPRGDVRRVAELLGRETRPLMFVGHRPFMDRLAGLLVAGDKERQVVRFSKGGIVCLEREAGTRSWSVVWAVTPDILA